ERGILPMGASSKNAGFACFGSPGELLDDLKKHSENELFALVEKRWKGLLRLRKNLGDAAIDFQNLGGYEVFDDTQEFSSCADQLSYLNKQLFPITGKQYTYHLADDKIKMFGLQQVKHMLVNTEEGQIDTGKMIHCLIKQVRATGVEIINGIEIKAIEDQEQRVSLVSTTDIRISCKQLIVATNGFAKQLLPFVDVQPARAQVLITHPIPDLKLKGTFHYTSGYYYFRNVGNRLLLGGGRNLDFSAEETAQFGLTQLVQTKLDELLKRMILPYTSYEIDMRWSGIMGLGNEKTTIVKALNKHIFCAVRLGGMGISIGSLIGEEVAELALQHR
ncbi:MAG TPA: FAD-dependent oxidoreductase, partial [Bacteroidia bacterium]|nr:FAD-dependent oxidoreductase [Bacteroidia bacterium]